MTFIEKFDELKAKYGKIDESKLSESFAIQIEMTDEDCGGIFYVAYVNGTFSVEPYDYHDHTAKIILSSKTLDDILSCKADPMEAFFSGSLSVDGDISHALLLVELMKKEEAKKPATKRAAKKAPEKQVEEKKSTEKAKTGRKSTKKKDEK